MTLLPRSLLARSILLISLILIARQVAWIQFYRMSSAQSRSDLVASSIVRTLETVATALESMPAASRRKFSERLPEEQNIRLYPASRLDVDELAVPNSPLLAAVDAQLKRERTGTNVLAMIEDADHALWVKIRVKQQSYWVVFAEEAFQLPPAAAWAGWSVVSLALALFGGLALMLRVNRPLQALADAAEEIAAGKTPDALPEQGPSEIRTLSRAFNHMSSALAQQENNRAVLLAGVSHDLRTPLSRLRLALEMSTERVSGAMRQGMEQDIEEMDAIIDQFLEFAREGASEAVDANGDLNALVSALAERYERRGEALTLRLAPLPPLPLRVRWALHRPAAPGRWRLRPAGCPRRAPLRPGSPLRSARLQARPARHPATRPTPSRPWHSASCPRPAADRSGTSLHRHRHSHRSRCRTPKSRRPAIHLHR